MRYLVDTNVFLEASLRRQHWEAAAELLQRTPATDLAVTDFTLHSLGFYLFRKTPHVFDAIVRDVVSRGLSILRVEPADLHRVTETGQREALDFDDAFLYTVAVAHDLMIVSLDADFDRTPRGRKAPADVLAALRGGTGA